MKRLIGGLRAFDARRGSELEMRAWRRRRNDGSGALPLRARGASGSSACSTRRPAGTARGAGSCSLYPHGHEYIQFHRVCRLLAIAPRRRGLRRVALRLRRVRRFVRRRRRARRGRSKARPGASRTWVDDARTAAAELRARSERWNASRRGRPPPGRGAGRAALGAAGDANELDALVLWDPVARRSRLHRGARGASTRDMLRYAHVRAAEGSSSGARGPRLRHARRDSETRARRRCDAQALERAPARRVLLIESHDKRAPGADARETLSQLGDSPRPPASSPTPTCGCGRRTSPRCTCPASILDADRGLERARRLA